MARMNGEASTGSWLRRVMAERATRSGALAEPDSAAGLLSRDSREGWDPYDVWLRHIDERRRRRDAALR